MVQPAPPDSLRLRFRPVEPGDFDFIFQLQSNADLMRYIRTPETDPGVVRERMEMWRKYAEQNPGMGAFIMYAKDSGEKIGNCVLRHVDYLPGNDLELGYLLLQDYWGKGFATEAARSLAGYAFSQFDVPKVVAVVDPENLASRNVLVKCGFRLVGRRFIYNSDNLEFVLER